MYYCCGYTGKGIRPHNEDAFMIHREVILDGASEQRLDAPFLIAVADGVAGEAAGEQASRLCLTKLASVKFNKRLELQAKLLEIHEAIVQTGCADPNCTNMQTTLCGIGIDESQQLHFFNVGDSRLYRYRSGQLRQLSRDQSLVQMLFEEGTITRAQQKTHVHRNIILPVMGSVSSAPKPEITRPEESMAYGDILLLCSDGLSDYVQTSDIEEILAMAKPMPKRLERLYARAVECGGKDNITIAAVVRYAS